MIHVKPGVMNAAIAIVRTSSGRVVAPRPLIWPILPTKAWIEK